MLAGVWTWVRLPPAPLFLCIPLHSFAFLGKTLLNQRFLFLSLVFLGILLRKKHTLKQTLLLKKGYKKGYNIFVVSKKNNFSFLRKTWDSNPRTLLHAYRVSNTAS